MYNNSVFLISIVQYEKKTANLKITLFGETPYCKVSCVDISPFLQKS